MNDRPAITPTDNSRPIPQRASAPPAPPPPSPDEVMEALPSLPDQLRRAGLL